MTHPKVPELATIVAEIQRAYLARESGKIGLARVCARRAAGWAIQREFATRGIVLNSPSALDHIKHLHAQQNVSPEVKKVLEYLLQRVAKDSGDDDSYWPYPEVDLVQEAHWLVESLLSVQIPPTN